MTVWMILWLIGVGGSFFGSFLALRHWMHRKDQKKHLEEKVKAFGGGLKPTQKANKEALFAYKRENKIQKRLGAYFQKGDGRRIRLHPSLRLKRAGMTLNYTQFILFGALVDFSLTFTLMAFFKLPILVCGPIGTVLTILLLHKFLKWMEERRQKRFLDLFPDALDMVLRAIRAGVTVERGFQMIVTEVQDPVGSEFRSICEQLAVGVSFEQALKDAADRLNLPDFDFFVVTLIIQRATGGSLADVLGNIITTLRKRSELRLKVKALSSEAWTTASIIGALPVIIFLVMHFVRPGYYDIFDTTSMGEKMKWFIIFCAVAGFISIRRIVRFETD